MINLDPYSLYIKLGAAVLAAAALLAVGWHFGSLGPKTELAQFQSKQAQLTADAVLAERAANQAEKERDHQTELKHAQVITQINIDPVNTAPVLVCEPAEIHSSPVSGTEGETNSSGTSTAERGGEPVDRGRDIRPAIEALKKRLERIMADYRQEDEEWARRTQ